jgi:hypothetical protein
LTVDHQQRARRAEMLLDDELVKEALVTLEADCVAAWTATGMADAAKREQAWLMLKSAQRFRGYLQAIVDDGKMELASKQAMTPYR